MASGRLSYREQCILAAIEHELGSDRRLEQELRTMRPTARHRWVLRLRRRRWQAVVLLALLAGGLFLGAERAASAALTAVCAAVWLTVGWAFVSALRVEREERQVSLGVMR